MARLILTPGETFGTIGGFSNTDVIGANFNETVHVASDAKVKFDPSFNRGGDVINIGGNAGMYTASRVGSSLLLTADNGAQIAIPIGTVGTTINFLDAPGRELIFENGAVFLGDQKVEGPPEPVVEGDLDRLLDFTAFGQDAQITYEFDEENISFSGRLYEATVRIADGDGNEVAGVPVVIELYKVDPANSDNNAPAVVWNRIEGGDFGETVIYEGSDDISKGALPGLDHRFTDDLLNLRGGDNEVHYNALNTSIVTEIAITAFNPAAPLNSDQITAVTTFTDGTAAMLPGEHTITSYATDNDDFPGTLRIQASQDQEDTVRFTAPGSLELALTAELIIVSTPTAEDTVTLAGYEVLLDNGLADDCYVFTDYSQVLAGGLQLKDDTGNDDHDAAVVFNDLVVDAIVDRGGVVDLEAIESDFSFDFDVLDLSIVTDASLVGADGSGRPNDELVIGELNNAAPFTVTNFASLVVSEQTVAKHGSTFTINGTANRVTAGSETIDLDGEWSNILSFNGALGDDLDNPRADSCVDAVITGVTVTTAGIDAVTIYGGGGNDTITGSLAGGDIIYGGMGADVLNGNSASAVLVQNIASDGTTGGTEPGSGGVFNLQVPATQTDLTAGNAPGGPNVYPNNSDADALGAKWASLPLASWRTAFATTDDLTTTEADALTSVTYDPVTNDLTFIFAPTPGGSTITKAELLDASDLGAVGNAVLNATERAEGFIDASDAFIYCSAAESTEASQDTILNFSIDTGTGSINDVIDLSLIDADTTTAVDDAFSGIVLNDSPFESRDAFLASLSSPGAMSGGDIHAGRTATDAFVVIDTDQSSAYNAGDMVIMLGGVTSLAAGTLDGTNFIF